MLKIPISLRTLATNLLLWFSFLSACVFYGVGDNQILLLFSTGLLLLAIALIPPARIGSVFSGQRPDGWICLWVLAFLVFSYHYLSISKESSFAVSWILASVPLWYLACAALRERRLLVVLLVSTISLFALVSDVRFFGYGQRAFEPLLDPNNYASLLYMCWIPLAHWLLLHEWRAPLKLQLRIPLYGLLMLLAVAIFATSSRVGTVIVALALIGWLLLAWRRRLRLTPWLVLFACTTAAYLLCLSAAPEIASSSYDAAEFATGVNVRGALNNAAWQMFLQSPIAGTGIFTFPALYPLFRQVGDQSTAGMFVHNDYLQLLAEAGIWLVIPLLVVAGATARRLWQALVGDTDRAYADFGPAMAVAALLAHASVNFVVYVLPLGIVFAVLCAELFPLGNAGADRTVAEAQAHNSLVDRKSAVPGLSRWISWFACMGLSLAAWVYLALDVAIQGVFAGQPTMGIMQETRANPESMLRFSRQVQGLNPDRDTPVLGEAMVMSALLERQVNTDIEPMEVLACYRRARAMDPLNPLVYEQFYRFLRKNLDEQMLPQLRADESPAALLLRAVQLDVRRVDSIFELLKVYDQLGQSEQAMTMLSVNVLPWLERVTWDNPEKARALMLEMRRRALALDDRRSLERIDERWAAIKGVGLAKPAHWLQHQVRAAFGP